MTNLHSDKIKTVNLHTTTNHIYTNTQLRKLLVPIIIEQLLASLMGTVDTMMVSNVGSAAISAVSLVDSINVLVIQAFSALAAGGAILCSQYIGQKNHEMANKSARQVLFIITAISVAVTALCLLFRVPLLKLIFGKVESDVMTASQVYFFYTALSFPFIALYDAGASIFRSQGNTRGPMTVSVISNVINIGGNAALIWGFNMGVAGAAIATVFSQGVSAILCYIYMMRRFDILKTTPAERKFDGALARTLMYIGVPMGLQFSITAIGSIMLQSANNALGTACVAAFTAAMRIKMFFMCPFESLGMAMATYSGQNYGAGKPERIWMGVKASALMMIVYWAFTFCVLMFGARTFALLFVDASELEILKNTELFLHISVSFFPVLGLLCILRYTIQGVGYTNLAMLSGVSEMIARILVSLLAVPAFGYLAVGFGDPTAWIFADAFLIPAFIYVYRRILRMKKN